MAKLDLITKDIQEALAAGEYAKATGLWGLSEDTVESVSMSILDEYMRNVCMCAGVGVWE